MDDLISEFLTETYEGLAELDTALVKLERTPGDQATLSFIFRLVHTIKGTCGFLGLPRLEKVAHAGENVLGRIRDGALSATPETISAIMAGLDRIKLIIADIAATGMEKPGDDTAVIAALDAVAEGRAPVVAASATPVPAAKPRKAAKPRAAAPAKAAPVAAAPSPAAVPLPVAPPAPVAHEAAASALPARAETAPDTAVVDPASQTIRLNVDVLENLMTLVSELVLTRNQLLQLSRTQAETAYAAPLQRLSHITSDLQEGVMKTRMQPIGHAWNKLPRLVRDLGRDLNKPIELVMRGQDTELDRQVLELIRDPLTHMVRNSGDHGLEAAETRVAAGKPPTGTITLNAYHEGGYILVEVSDDGAGLPLDRIRAKVLSRGLATEAELAAMGQRELERFIFHAGFSTAAAVTAVSGRGVGMDVVKTNIERIGGTIELESTAGKGTTFTIKIPLTLAIISALIVESRGERFAIPQLSVVELVRPSSRAGENGPAIETIDGTPVLRLRERLLPLIDLGGLLRIEAPAADAKPVETVVVVMSVGAATVGIVVDRVFDTEEIVVKPVAPILRHITMFSGNTILGDGSVIMILDPNGIARAVGLNTGAAARLSTAATAASAEHSGGATAMLLFRREPGGAPCAVPLGLVARIEDIPRERIEMSSGRLVTQYRSQLMPLLQISPGELLDGNQPVLVFADRGRSMGLMVAEIVDVVESPLAIELSSGNAGLLGSAVIGGRATDILDAGYWMTQAWQDWFRDVAGGPAKEVRPRLLVVEDSAFFRQLVVPALSAAGYHVVAVDSAAKALALQAREPGFDCIVSDIEMPDMDGLAFARHVRQGGPWAHLPLIALSGRATAEDIARGKAAGFTDYVAKFEREPLLAALQRALSPATALSMAA